MTCCSRSLGSITPVKSTLDDGRLAALPRYEPVRTHEDGERLYSTPIGPGYSVTTILAGSRDNSSLELWRESVGAERADFISSFACFRGSEHHLNIERFLTDGTEPEFSFATTPYWKSTRSFLDTIERPVLLEGTVWHPDGFAGMLDALCYLKGDGLQPTLLDWKSADSIRKPDKIYEYSLQCAAYRAAANYVYADYGLNITRAKIVVAIADSSPQIVTLERAALDQLYLHFKARHQHFTFARQRR